VKAINGQGIASAATAAMNTGNAVTVEDVCVSTQTISPEVLDSAERMALAIRS
jgi:hypothetical protein